MTLPALPIRAAAVFAIAYLILSASGCTIFPPAPDKSRFFILTAGTAAPSTPDTNNLAIGLGPLQLPTYVVSRDEIATRTDSNRIEYSPINRWAAPLDENFQQVLARDLAAMIGTDQILIFPWVPSTHIDYRVTVDLQHFERDTSAGSVLSGQWQIHDGNTDRILRAGNAYFTAPAAPDSANGLSSDVGQLSHQIADAITALHAQQNAARPSPE